MAGRVSQERGCKIFGTSDLKSPISAMLVGVAGITVYGMCMNAFHSMDLNLLRVFTVLMEERNVTRAGERLNVTQSAVSHALTKLRQSIDDPLFVRTPEGMRPTPRAIELSHDVAAALAQLETALLRPSFDPTTAQLEFSIGCSDYMITTLFSPFMAAIEKSAPGVKLWLRPNSDTNIVEELDRGTLQAAVGVFGGVPSRIVKTELFTETFVWAMRKEHPAALEEALTVEQVALYRHVDILIAKRDTATASGIASQDGLERAYILSYPPYLDAFFREKGLSRVTGATVSHILAVPPLLAQTDMVSLIPRRFAELARQTLGLVIREAPGDAPPVRISMLTHRTMGSHPSITWLSQRLQEVAQSMTA